MNSNDKILPKGEVEIIIDHKDGSRDCLTYYNAVVQTGRQALANCLANEIGGEFNYFVSRMLFGDGGALEGEPLYVTSNRNALFGTTRATKNVIANIDPNIPSQVVFTSVLSFNDANGYALSEMALQLNTSDFYSMATFPPLSKTDSIQITFNWRISFV